MEIHQELIQKVNNCCWLENCGKDENLDYNFDFEFIKSRSKMTRSINSLKWENISVLNFYI